MKALEENIGAYCNILHGFILLCHGNTVGAGPTLHANINVSAKQVVERSLTLLREAVSSYGVHYYPLNSQSHKYQNIMQS